MSGWENSLPFFERSSREYRFKASSEHFRVFTRRGYCSDVSNSNEVVLLSIFNVNDVVVGYEISGDWLPHG